jgi:hypothetical protein
VAAAVLAGTACASLPRATPEQQRQALTARSYRAELGVRLRGPELVARTRALVAFARPDRMRLEIAGPAGARFVAVASGGTLLAVFPSERALFRGDASADEMERLIGVALSPAQMMDALLGSEPPGVRAYRADWGPRLPRRIETTLRDGARLRLDVAGPEPDVALPAQAFDAPQHAGYRQVDAAEARTLWSR